MPRHNPASKTYSEGQLASRGDLVAGITTLSVDAASFRFLQFEVVLTRRGGGFTAIQHFIETGLDGTNFGSYQDQEEPRPPIKTLKDDQYDKTIADNARYSFDLKVETMAHIRLRITATAALPGDVVDVFFRGIP